MFLANKRRFLEKRAPARRIVTLLGRMREPFEQTERRFLRADVHLFLKIANLRGLLPREHLDVYIRFSEILLRQGCFHDPASECNFLGTVYA